MSERVRDQAHPDTCVWDKASHVNRVVGKLRVAVKATCGFGVRMEAACGFGVRMEAVKATCGFGVQMGAESNMWIRGADGAQ